ncbi:hypothetical protein SCA6_014822 [Theobroma cacao]
MEKPKEGMPERTVSERLVHISATAEIRTTRLSSRAKMKKGESRTRCELHFKAKWCTLRRWSISGRHETKPMRSTKWKNRKTYSWTFSVPTGKDRVQELEK